MAGVFEVGAWEFIARAAAHYRQKDLLAAVAELKRGLPAHRNCWPLLYDLACYESVVGDRESALEHLRHAVEENPRAAELAREDRDLDAIRDDSRFSRLVLTG